MAVLPFGVCIASILAAVACAEAPGPSSAPEPPGAPRLVVTPRTVTLPAHDSIRFFATVRDNDGQEISLPVVWMASAGTITASGDYTPPDTAGDYRVIAAVLGLSLNDTVHVTVMPDTAAAQPPSTPDTSATPPPPPGGYPDTTGSEPPPPPGNPDTTGSGPPPPIDPAPSSCTNEPLGLTLITERSFDARVENGWQDRGGERFSIVQDSGALKSAPNVGEAKYPAGFPSGSGPIATWFTYTTEPRTVFICLWIKMSDSWYGNSSGGNKVIFFSIAGGNRVYLDLRGTGSAPLHAGIDFQGMGVVDNSSVQRSISWNGLPNLGQAASEVVRGRWTKWEILLVANTPGAYDGQAHWWINGNKVGQYTAIGYSSASETGSKNAWSGILWNPTYGGGGPAVPNLQYMWIDHIYVTGK